MKLGTQTHFEINGWPTSLVDTARSLGVQMIRSGAHWAAIEVSPGVYKYPTWYYDWMQKMAVNNMSPIVGLGFNSGFHDQGLTPYTAAGRQAYAEHAVATIRQFRGQIKTVEIMNEFNLGS